MELQLEIHRLTPGLYAYSIHTDAPAHARTRHYESAFDSLETCLRDAGCCLGDYFSAVQIHMDGRPRGLCLIESLRRRPEALSLSLRGQLPPLPPLPARWH